jgi:integrase
VTRDGKRREIGIGSYPALSLSDARAQASRLRAEVKAGGDPIASRRAAKAKQIEARERTFAAVAAMVHGQREFATAALSKRWIGRLRRYAFPMFGQKPVEEVDGPTVLSALEPIWQTKPETARRVRQLVASVLDYAHVMGWRERSPDLPKLTKQAFPAQRKVTHHAAVDYIGAPEIIARLCGAPETTGRLALLFAIYTAARSGEVRSASWDEIDMENRVWRVPANKMKMKRDHSVPLSVPALRILERVGRCRETSSPEAFVFLGQRVGSPLSDMTLAKAQKIAAPGTTVHGWRSTFRDWAGETTAFPSDVVEAALAHQIGSATTRAYQRGDLFAKRRLLMDEWARYCEPKCLPSCQT